MTYDSGVLTVVEYPSHDNTDCRCETEASFIIENVPEGDLMLRIYHGDTSGRYDVGTPGYSGRIEFVGGRMSGDGGVAAFFSVTYHLGQRFWYELP